MSIPKKIFALTCFWLLFSQHIASLLCFIIISATVKAIDRKYMKMCQFYSSAKSIILARKYHWEKSANSELTYSDEREKVIALESTKIAYKLLTGGLIVTIAAIGGVKFFSLSTSMDISTYSTSVALLTVLLDIATILYFVKWYREYKKQIILSEYF